MTLDTLESLLVDQLRDVLYAEKQLVKTLPKLAKAATAPELKSAFKGHAEATEEHVTRLEQALQSLGVAPKGKKCPAMDGLIEEANEMLAHDGSPSVIDAGLIASAQRAEHYEIGAYGSIRAFAEALGHGDIVALADATLQDEKAADAALSEISFATILPAALGAAEEDEDSEEEDAGASEDEASDEDSASPAPARSRERRTRAGSQGSTRI